MRCVTKNHVLDYASATVGTPALPITDENKLCLTKGIVLQGRHLVLGILKQNAGCQNAAPNADTCADPYLGGNSDKLLKSRRSASLNLAKACGAASVAAIGSCATDASEVGCVINNAQIYGTVLAYDTARMLGEVDPDPDSILYSKLAAGGGNSYACAIHQSGFARCWGNNLYNRAVPPPGRFTSLATTDLFACGLRADGSVDCWGGYDTWVMNGPGSDAASPPKGSFTRLAGAPSMVCGIRSDGSLACWGATSLVFGSPAPPLVNLPPPSGQFTDVSIDGYTGCALRSDGSIACWGDNESGLASPPTGAFVSLVVGCAIRADDHSIQCWGSRASPPSGAFDRLVASAGDERICAMRADGTIACWPDFGTPPAGTLLDVGFGNCSTLAVAGDGTLASGTPTALPLDGQVLQIGPGGFLRADGTVTVLNGCGDPVLPTETFLELSYDGGLRTDGAIESWGTGGTTVRPGPYKHLIYGGAVGGCGIAADDSYECWGVAPPSFPQEPTPDGPFVQIIYDNSRACGLRENSSAVCWGFSSYHLNDVPEETFAELGGGGICGLLPDETALCWAVTSAPAGTFTSISDGRRPTCAVRTDGTMDCWKGEFGPGNFGLTPGPYLFTKAGDGCGLRTDGTVKCWGAMVN